MRAEKDREKAMTTKDVESVLLKEYLFVENDSKIKVKGYFKVICDYFNWDKI